MTFNPQHFRIKVKVTRFNNEIDQTLRLVGVELVNNNDSFSSRVRGNGLDDVVNEVLLGAGGANGGGCDFACSHLEVNNQTLRSVSDVLKLLPFNFSGFHRFGGMFTLQSLNAGFFIGADDTNAGLIQLGGLTVHIAHRFALFGKGLGVLRLGVEPIATPVRFQIGFVQKTSHATGGNGRHNFPLADFISQLPGRPMADRPA